MQAVLYVPLTSVTSSDPERETLVSQSDNNGVDEDAGGQSIVV